MAITFTTSPSPSVKENLRTVMAVGATTDSGNPVTYSISGGADAALFNISGNGVLAFKTTPNYETPHDADGNNIYDVTVEAADGVTTSSQNIAITVTNVDDAMEKVEDLASLVATDVANLELATNALATDKADKQALDLANQSIQQLAQRADNLEGKVDVPGSVSEAIANAAQQVKDDLLNGVSTEFDTFKEVADQFAQNGDLIAALQNVGAGAIRFDIAQLLNASQQERARLNMGAASEAEFQEHKAEMGNNATFDPVGAYAQRKAAQKAQ